MKYICALIVILGLAIFCQFSIAQTDTTFTYQGELNENGAPAKGSFNFDFSLWDALAGGNQIGLTDVHNGVQVVDGRFTVELDFGASVFDNSNRWLEILVNGIMLSPRIPITRVPYAIQTRGIFVDDNYDVGIGTVLPEIVQYEENGVDAHGMDYSKLTPQLVEAVNALNDQQNSLERENASLQARNDALHTRLDSLEKLVEQLASTQQEKTK